MEGVLMIPRRKNFHKVYDLRERVLPEGVDASMPSQDELCRHLIFSNMRAHGLALSSEMAYLRRGLGARMSQTAANMVEEGGLQRIRVGNQAYYCTTENLNKLGAEAA